MAKYDDIISAIFKDRYSEGVTSIVFEREDLAAKARDLGLNLQRILAI